MAWRGGAVAAAAAGLAGPDWSKSEWAERFPLPASQSREKVTLNETLRMSGLLTTYAIMTTKILPFKKGKGKLAKVGLHRTIFKYLSVLRKSFGTRERNYGFYTIS